ncbi:MAG TPA: PBP1A family penicillin-binding protein [Gemmatimonadaceae bacterium]
MTDDTDFEWSWHHRLRGVAARRLAILRERMRPDPGDPPRVWARRRWKSLAALALVVIAVATADVWLASCGFEGCPTSAELRAFRPAEGGRILDRNGRLLGRLRAVRRINVELDRVPMHVRQAFLATEDRRFYDHDGLDWRGFARAVVRNLGAFGVREGFSTITMQVARNAFVDGRFRNRSLPKKLMEMRLARLLERTLSKDQILELYLNVIYLGNGSYGVQAASRDLFAKDVERLTVDEGAMLAALPKGPSAYTPRRDRNRAMRRRNLVLGLMAREGYITDAGAAAAVRRPLVIADEPERDVRVGDSFALDAVRQLVDSAVSDRVGELVVFTTLDARAQSAAERAIERRAAAIQRESNAWSGRRADRVQGALVALDPATGEIRALVGGSRYERAGFNRALAARRQPGSAFKPFVYAAALRAGFTPASMVDDEPVEVQQRGKIWTPANYGDEYEGSVTLRRALMRSSNAAAVRVSRAVGEANVIAAARRNGIESPLEAVPSIALGALEVTPLELVAAYAPFANGGDRVTPVLVRRIEAADGTLLWSSDVARARVMDPVDAYQLTAMLRGVVDHGTGRALRGWGVDGPVAGKTGTTNEGADVWFVGYTPTLVAGVWFGFDKPHQISGNASGGRLAAPAWAEFYTNGWRERGSERDWAPPAGLTEVEIDPETGELAGEWCPSSELAYFRPGTEPTGYCRFHEPSEEHWADGFGERIEQMLKKVFRF